MQQKKRNTEDDEWRDGWLADVVADPDCRSAAMEIARGLRQDGDPHVSVADLEASTAYLRKALGRRPVTELGGMTLDRVAALWARGAHGAACYRARTTAIHRRH
jgi:hypothetical protein